MVTSSSAIGKILVCGTALSLLKFFPNHFVEEYFLWRCVILLTGLSGLICAICMAFRESCLLRNRKSPSPQRVSTDRVTSFTVSPPSELRQTSRRAVQSLMSGSDSFQDATYLKDPLLSPCWIPSGRSRM